MPDVIESLLLTFSLYLETFFNGAYLSRVKLITKKTL